MSGPLSGIVVVDLTRALAGPHATMMLGDLGARVIKVEHPDGGDETRGWGPPFVGPADNPVSTYFLACNRNKESVTADLKSEWGRELLTRLVARADVLAENFRSGVLDRLGFTVERLHEINPGLVICSLTGFGHDGPEGGRSGYDHIAQGEAGLMSVTGPSPDQPTKVGVPIGDLLAGVHAAYGVASALYERTRTGRGTVVRSSLLASIVGVHAFQGTRWTVAGETPQAIGNDHPSIVPYGAFTCPDGMIQIAAPNDNLWRRLAGLLGLDPDDPRFLTNTDRVRRRAELTEVIERALATASRDEWLPRLAEAGVPAGAIRTFDQVYEWEQTRSQGLVVETEHPQLGRIELPGPPLRFDAVGARGDPSDEAAREAGAAGQDAPAVHAAPPLLGQHTADVLAWLDGLDAADRADAGTADGADRTDGADRGVP